LEHKIAIITDIHANINALETIFYDISVKGCNEIIHLGDSVDIGPEPKKTLEMLINNNVTLILGNHEQYYLKKGVNLPSNIKNNELEHYRWTYKELGDHYINNVKNLPLRVEREINGYKVVFIHYPIDEQGKKDNFKGHLKDINYNNVDDFFNEEADIVFFGHQHNFIDIESPSTGIRYINPGAAGCTKSNMTNYTILNFNNDGYSVENRRLKYNKKRMVEDLIDKNVPDAKFIISIFYGIE
jgi:predicted phosphodiesterase